MTVSESRDRLRDRYIDWYMITHNLRTDEDAKYTWWEREKDCQQWSDKEGTYVPMSDSKTLRVMRGWFKKIKNTYNRIRVFLVSKKNYGCRYNK